MLIAFIDFLLHKNKIYKKKKKKLQLRMKRRVGTITFHYSRSKRFPLPHATRQIHNIQHVWNTVFNVHLLF
ncbi:Uncharacterized protein TCM_009395 [Theobroma cacao]|uniref:Uncharacterized protein n=1 Tax=Theobroma cacao TaxID=3641 RepID=A0A061ECK5_THECC|nr:Uncharacterized protein TCM_009395 [Theobroma cacao]